VPKEAPHAEETQHHAKRNMEGTQHYSEQKEYNSYSMHERNKMTQKRNTLLQQIKGTQQTIVCHSQREHNNAKNKRNQTMQKEHKNATANKRLQQ